MKILCRLLLFSFLINACTQRTSGSEDTEYNDAENNLTPSITAELQGNWERLTQWSDGSWVVFRPCDADNLSMTIDADTLIIGWGQDATYAIIDNIEKDEVPNRYAVTIYDPETDETLTYFLEWQNDDHTLARWWLWGPEQAPDLLVRADILDQYKEFKQPCHECWDDCDEENSIR